MHSISGGVFPFPPAVTDLVKRLPPPTAFMVHLKLLLFRESHGILKYILLKGPFVKVDELIKKIQEVNIHMPEGNSNWQTFIFHKEM